MIVVGPLATASHVLTHTSCKVFSVCMHRTMPSFLYMGAAGTQRVFGL